MAPITNSTDIPIHGLQAGGDTSLYIRAIAHSNQYDFIRKHRHSYYEILFFEKGGGRQLIDFEDLCVQDHSCYLVLCGVCQPSSGTLGPSATRHWKR